VRLASTILLAAAIVTSAAASKAEHPSARVEYVIDPALASRCPNERSMRDFVLARLNYDPFDGRPGLFISARVLRLASQLRGELEIKDAEGRLLGTREVSSMQEDCTELVQTMAFAVAIAIDPRTNANPSPRSAKVPPNPERPRMLEENGNAPPSEPPPVDRAVSVAGPSTTSTPTMRLRLGAGAQMSTGILPSTLAWGIFGLGSLHGQRFSLDLEGGGFLPSARDTSLGRVTAWLVVATVAPCWHGDPWLVCPRGSVGLLHGSADVQDPHDRTTPYVGVGAQVGLEVPLGRRLFGRIVGHLDAPVSPTTLEIDGSPAWTTPPANGGLTATFVGDFF
jgi:hypothetical protein